LKIADLAPQLIDALALRDGIDHRDVIFQSPTDGLVRLFNSAAVIARCPWIGIEESVIDVHEAEEHLRTDG